jgi:hypothetical protein
VKVKLRNLSKMRSLLKSVLGTISIAGQEFTVNAGANEPPTTLRLRPIVT